MKGFMKKVFSCCLLGAMLGFASVEVMAEETSPEDTVADAQRTAEEYQNTKQDLSTTQTNITQTEESINTAQNELETTQRELNAAQAAYDNKNNERLQAEQELNQANSEVASLEQQAQQAQTQINKGVIGYWETLNTQNSRDAIALLNEYSSYISTNINETSTSLTQHKKALEQMYQRLFECRDKELSDPQYLKEQNAKIQAYNAQNGANRPLLDLTKFKLYVAPYVFAQSMINSDASMVYGYIGHRILADITDESLELNWGNSFNAWYNVEKRQYAAGERNMAVIGHYVHIVTLLDGASPRVIGYSQTNKQYNRVGEITSMQYNNQGGVYSYTAYYNHFMNYYNNLYGVQAKLDAAKQKQSKALSAYNTLKTETNTLFNSVTALKKSVSEKTNKINQLNTKLSTLKADKTRLEKKLENIEKQLESYKGYYANDWTFTGLDYAGYDGQLHLFVNGVVDTKRTGIFKNTKINKDVYVSKGLFDKSFTGLAKHSNGKWYFFRNGVFEKFTGLSKSRADGKYYFSRNGILDWNFTGVAKSVTNGQWYHAKKGRLDWGFTGFSKSVADGKWYFSRKGKLNWNFTGVAKSVANGKWYFARNGRLDWGFTGVGKSVADGKWYAVHKGKLNWNYNGGAISSFDGRWYAVQRGRLNWNYTGQMRCHDGLFRYFYRGVA